MTYLPRDEKGRFISRKCCLNCVNLSYNPVGCYGNCHLHITHCDGIKKIYQKTITSHYLEEYVCDFYKRGEKKKMNTYYEVFLRRDIFPTKQEAVDLVMDVYDADEKERHYINYVIEDYIKGASEYLTRRRLQRNIVDKYLHIRKKLAKKSAYLDEEYKNKMKGED